MKSIGPGIASGKLCPWTVSLNDIYPTIAEFAGVTPPHALAGRSLVPLTRGPNTPGNHPALTTYCANNHAIRNERYRDLRYDDGGEELYDHDNDPHEWKNLAGGAEAAEIIEPLASGEALRRHALLERLAAAMPWSFILERRINTSPNFRPWHSLYMSLLNLGDASGDFTLPLRAQFGGGKVQTICEGFEQPCSFFLWKGERFIE